MDCLSDYLIQWFRVTKGNGYLKCGNGTKLSKFCSQIESKQTGCTQTRNCSLWMPIEANTFNSCCGAHFTFLQCHDRSFSICSYCGRDGNKQCIETIINVIFAQPLSVPYNNTLYFLLSNNKTSSKTVWKPLVSFLSSSVAQCTKVHTRNKNKTKEIFFMNLALSSCYLIGQLDLFCI